MILNLSKKFDHPFVHDFYLVTCFLTVTVSFLCRLQDVSKIHVPIHPYLISVGRRNCSTVWPAQQQNWISGNMSRNIKTCKNGWSNFSENLRIVKLKLLELARFISPNITIYFNFLQCWGPVVMLTFLNYRPCVVY